MKYKLATNVWSNVHLYQQLTRLATTLKSDPDWDTELCLLISEIQFKDLHEPDRKKVIDVVLYNVPHRQTPTYAAIEYDNNRTSHLSSTQQEFCFNLKFLCPWPRFKHKCFERFMGPSQCIDNISLISYFADKSEQIRAPFGVNTSKYNS